MSARHSPGFTIIETVLFLSVTGLLILGVLIGAGASINRQRYRDAVESFKEVLQTQYADLGSLRNDRTGTWRCDTAAVATAGGAGAVARGQSECLMVGKYVRIDKADITIYKVLAREKTSAVKGNDVTRLASNYAYNISTDDIETRTLDWGTSIGWPMNGSGVRPSGTTLGILMIRSPDSGSIYTFTNNAIPPKTGITQATFTDMIVPGAVTPGQAARTVCVVSNGLVTTGDMSIHIDSFAASASAIDTQTNEYIKSQGLVSQC